MTLPQPPVLLDRIPLDNGLCVEFYDASRAMAGDRMQVVLLIRIPLQADPAHFADCEQPEQDFQRFGEIFGDHAAFEQRKIRNFVDRRQAAEVLQQLRDEFLRSNRGYLGHPRFAQRSVLRLYRDWLEQHPRPQP